MASPMAAWIRAASSVSRRQVLHGGTVGLAGLAAGVIPERHRERHHERHCPGRLPPLPATCSERLDPAVVQQLALRAVDAARAAGATYADVRLTRTVSNGLVRSGGGVELVVVADSETYGVGVRCRVGGCWGFAASPYWRADEMPILARTAVTQARATAQGAVEADEWVPIPAVTGHWATPCDVDPFTVSMEERISYLAAVQALGVNSGKGHGVWRQEWALATSEGTYVTQTLYQRGKSYSPWRPSVDGPTPAPPPRPGHAGWEVARNAVEDWVVQAPLMREEGERIRHLPVKTTELGQYDLVLDGAASARLVNATLAQATQLDRALGYELLTDGGSYLGPDPLALLGQFPVGSPHLALTAGRRMWYQWDAEGVVPEEAPLIQDGILVDYQTTREQAAWLRPYYEQVHKPVRSHGYAWGSTALDGTIQHIPQLELASSTAPTPGSEMIKGIKKGIYAFGDISSGTDSQAQRGLISLSGGMGLAREIVDGKLGAFLTGGQVLFDSVELWRSLVAVGPAAEGFDIGFSGSKGQPGQDTQYTVRGVPVHFKRVTVVR